MPELDLPDLVLVNLAAGVPGVTVFRLEPDGVTDNFWLVRYGGSIGLEVSRSVLLRPLFPVLEDPSGSVITAGSSSPWAAPLPTE